MVGLTIKIKGEVIISKGKTHSPGPERKFTFSTNKIENENILILLYNNKKKCIYIFKNKNEEFIMIFKL